MQRAQQVLCLMGVLLGAAALDCRTGAPGPVKSAETRRATGGDKVLPNGSFEEVDSPHGWRTHTWQGQGTFACSNTGHTGAHSVMIRSEQGGDAGWIYGVEVKPFSTYRLSGWIRTENVTSKGGKGALFNVGTQDTERTRALTGTHDWTRVETTFDTGDRDWLEVTCLFGGWGLATGTAWYDDVSLEFVSSRTLHPAATLDVTQTGPPISKYIYGQFIEHLGRCIYGGIWAEMLEDRKFYLPVGAEKSPWRAVGDPGRVRMSETKPFVGEHTPVVELAGDGVARGIVQSGLGLVAHKEYVGRVVLAGVKSAAPVEISLIWGDEPTQRQTVTVSALTSAYTTWPLRFTAGAATDQGRIEIVSRGKGRFRIGSVSLMPADNVHGLRADTLALLKQLDSPIYRWPGGNFVSGYNWRDGIGDPDKRPPRKNLAWKGLEENDFGLDEFMMFCRELGTEPYITVNAGLGDADEAAEEVQYANGAVDTPMGKLRARNGHPAPYHVVWWSIGNEMYGSWQLGHIPLAAFEKKNNEFADAMRAVDPSIKLIANGATGPWSQGMLEHCAGHMDLLSEHFYCNASPGVISHAREIADLVRAKAAAQERYLREIPALKGRFIPIALDEWNYWYGPEPYGQIGTRYYLKDALGVAEGLQELYRHSGLFFMANYAQTVNVLGAIKTSKTAAAFDATGLALMMYRRHYGAIPVAVSGDCAPLDVTAAWRADRKALTIGVVNPTQERQTLVLAAPGVTVKGPVRCWILTGDSPQAYNTPEDPARLRVEEKDLSVAFDALPAPPLSAVIFEAPVG